MRTRLGLVVLAITLLALPSAGEAPKEQAPFSITISAPQTVKPGAAVPLVISVKNITTARIGFVTDVSRALVFDFLFNVKDSEGKEAEETPYYRAAQGKDPHRIVFSRMHRGNWLSPGETLKSYMDLTQLFNFKPGNYVIQLSRPQSHPPSPLFPTLNPPFVMSNVISLTVTP